MARYLVDEDMPRSLARLLRQSGYAAEDVRDVGLAGHSDHDVLVYARSRAAVLITADKGFADLTQYPLGTHAGIIVARVPNSVPVQRLNQEVLRGVSSLANENLSGWLVILELGRLRIRRYQPSP